jgi:hypothetical protein
MKWGYIVLGVFIVFAILGVIGKYQDTHIVKSIHVGTQP